MIKTYKNIVAVHPGYYVRNLIIECGYTQQDLAHRLIMSEEELRQLLQGKTQITLTIAQNLSLMLGTSVKLWFNMQKRYDENLLKIQKKKKTTYSYTP